MKNFLSHAVSRLYHHCYALYYPIYKIWKVYSEREERRLFRQLIKPGMTVVDVGANIGIYTCYFYKLASKDGTVHAFEPDSTNFKHLQKNTRHFSNIVVNHSAVGDHCGSIKLYISDAMNVDHRTFDSGDGRRSIDVRILSLDDYFQPGQAVDFIKIDVQGYELSVLKGAKRILTENRNIKILMEFWPYGLTKASVVPSDVIDFILSLGFTIRHISESKDLSFDGSEFDPLSTSDYCNLLITRQSGCE